MMAAITIPEMCSKILSAVRTCNLNYSCQETPFSIYLTIRKSLSKQQQVHQSSQQLSEPVLQALLEGKQNEIVSLKGEITELKTELKASEDNINHHKKEKEILDKKDGEIKLLESSIKRHMSESERVNTEQKNLTKALKIKEKEVNKLETLEPISMKPFRP